MQHKDRLLRLVSSAYGVAIRPERFEEYLQAWDDWFDALIDGEADALEEVSPIFDDALHQTDHLDEGLPASALERAPAPLLLVDAADGIVAMNAMARNVFAEEGLDPHAALRDGAPVGEAADRGSAVRLEGGAGRRSYLAVEAPLKPALAAEHPAARRAFCLSLMDWHAGFEAALRRRLDISAAELRVARGLYEGRTAQEISGDLGRSLPTVRSHIKSLLQKTGARRQAELVQLLTILRQVLDVDGGAGGAAAEAGAAAGGYERIELTGPAGRLQVVRYGAGRPLLYFTTSSPPEETAPFRAALDAAGFAVTAPVRPGFGGSDRAEGDASDALLDHWLDTLLQLAGPNPLLAGHREGGILAARAAERILARGGRVSGLALLSTGAPVRTLDALAGKPPSIRRSFIGAQIAAPATRLGYRAAARLFHAGALGQDKVIRFFHKESPVDGARLADPAFYEATRALLMHSFDDPDQIVRDVAAWGGDWSATLDAASAAVPVLFVHGAAHPFHPLEEIRALSESGAAVRLLPLEGAGQLAVLERPEAAAAALRALGT